MYKKVSTDLNFVDREKAVEQFWKEDKIFDRVELMKTPIVRNGKQATVGFCPEVWEKWE